MPRDNRTRSRPIGRATHVAQVAAVQHNAKLAGWLLDAADACADPRVAEWFRQLAKGDSPEVKPTRRKPAPAK